MRLKETYVSVNRNIVIFGHANFYLGKAKFLCTS